MTSQLLRPARLAALLLATAGLAAGCTSLGEWERQAIFSPSKGEQRWHQEPLAGTEIFDLAVGADRVRAWYTPAAQAGAPTVLYLHGARWNLNGSVFRIERWQQMGFNVLAIDYRGFGASSEIVPSEDSARADVRAALAELQRREPDPARRVLYGHSLGGALAIDLAADPSGAQAFSAVVVHLHLDPGGGGRHEVGLDPGGLDLAIRQRFESLEKVGRVQAPLLIVHGTEDRLVPPAMAEQLLAAARSPRKQIVKLEGAGHSGASRHPGYASAVLDFLAASPAAGEQLSAAPGTTRTQ